MTPSPVIALNRAVAVSFATGVEDGLRELVPLEAALGSYGPFHSARSELLSRAGRTDEALAVAERALALAANPAERKLLDQRIEELRAR